MFESVCRQTDARSLAEVPLQAHLVGHRLRRAKRGGLRRDKRTQTIKVRM